MRRMRRLAADYEELARRAGVPPDKAREVLKNMRRENVVHVAGTEVVPGSPRARALFALGPAANDDGALRLARAWA
ncbi:MAG TPA: hypothetical protein VEA40_00420 [Ramlibacter sp.]|nr:hypothetical protein [Ramlibacter sp.]